MIPQTLIDQLNQAAAAQVTAKDSAAQAAKDAETAANSNTKATNDLATANSLVTAAEAAVAALFAGNVATTNTARAAAMGHLKRGLS